MINFAENIETIIVAVAGIGAWLGERHKRRSDQVRLAKDIIAMYKEALDDFEVKRKLEKVAYKKDFNGLRHDLDEWKERYNEMERKYIDLRKEFETYKRKHK